MEEDIRGIRKKRRRERKKELKEGGKGTPEEGRGKHDPPQYQAYSTHFIPVSSPAPFPFSC